VALGRDEDALVDTLQALLVEPQRKDLQPQILALYRRIDSDGCGFTGPAGGPVTVHPDCPAAQRLVCPAYGELVRTRAGASNFAAAKRAEAIARFRSGAEQGFRCSQLGDPELAVGRAP